MKWSHLKGLLRFLLGMLVIWASVTLAQRYASAKVLPVFLSLFAWWTIEKLHKRGLSPMHGPWATPTSENGRAISAFWPIWRFAFFINCIATSYFVLKPDSSVLAVGVVLSPWVIFSFVGVVNILFHQLAGSIETLESWVGIARQLVYLVIGFVPFGLMCLLSVGAIPFVYVGCKAFNLDFIFEIRKLGQISFRVILRYLDFIDFIQVDFNGLDKLSNESQILVGNHISMFDIISVLAYVPNCSTFIKSGYSKIPFLAPMISACGFIPIDISDPESRKNAMRLAEEAIENGSNFVVWPEGTRTKSGQLGAFQNGVFRLALQRGVTVYPIVFTSNYPVFNKSGALEPFRGKVEFGAQVLEGVRVEKSEKVTPGKVVNLRELFVKLFKRELSQPNIPSWMRQINCAETAPDDRNELKPTDRVIFA